MRKRSICAVLSRDPATRRGGDARVLMAESGEQGLKLVREQRPQVIRIGTTVRREFEGVMEALG